VILEHKTARQSIVFPPAIFAVGFQDKGVIISKPLVDSPFRGFKLDDEAGVGDFYNLGEASYAC
jgi:hypothetical protein